MGSALAAFTRQMFFNHLWVSLGEGLVTAGVMAAVARAGEKRSGLAPAWMTGAVLTGLGMALVSPWLTSSQPDGYQAALRSSGLEQKLAETRE
ncbi:MAG: hypothetical protein HGA76_12305 [Candidatus Firestonebacteria bacterium]|nr:hypothetical protein [Candidatus Firestonebacteria bacterium]